MHACRHELTTCRGVGRLRTLAVVAAVAGATGGAHALTGTGTFNVRATISNSCTVTAATVAFGAVSPGVATTNTASNVTLTCNKGTTFTSLYLNNGANATGTTKRMASGGERLTYRIDVPTGSTLGTCPTAGSTEWRNGVGPSATTLNSLFATTGGAKSIRLCASIPAGQYPAAGSYLDTVTITATYN